MSCNWDIVCLDCNEEMGLENQLQDICRALVKARAVFELAADVWDHPYGYRLEPEMGPAINSEFFAKHRAHALSTISEYGDIADVCREYLMGQTPSIVASPVRQCALLAGHINDRDHEMRPREQLLTADFRKEVANLLRAKQDTHTWSLEMCIARAPQVAKRLKVGAGADLADLLDMVPKLAEAAAESQRIKKRLGVILEGLGRWETW